MKDIDSKIMPMSCGPQTGTILLGSIDLNDFKSWRSYYDFRNSVLHESRFFRSPSEDQFLEAVLESSKDRVQAVPIGTKFWRAQLGSDWEPINADSPNDGDAPCPFQATRMKPQPNMASEGRANPKGLPYLYVATDKETAMAEVRPWIGSSVSLALLQTNRELKLLNCTSPRNSVVFFLEEPGPEERERSVWSDIDRAFSTPITATDQTADYVPTQILAEFFRSKGLDGVAYRSSVGHGHNLAIFDVSAADVTTGFLYEVKDIQFIFSASANPYFVSRFHDPQPD